MCNDKKSQSLFLNGQNLLKLIKKGNEVQINNTKNKKWNPSIEKWR